ncbi:MAG: S49 family peptidase [Chloroflexota bacterium]
MSQTKEAENSPGRPLSEKIALYVIGIAVAIVAGYYLALALIPTPKIGIIRVDTQVTDFLAEAMAQEITYARQANDIKGIVMVVNSPGGSASAGHDIYFQFRKLREEKPVVASMDILAASAAYQIAIAANEIYAKPASLVGNIGVIVGLPQPETLSEQFLTTGPFKAVAFSVTGITQKLDLLYADFRDSVVAERSTAPNPLKLSPEEVATGEIWVGLEAKEYGLVDAMGSQLDAIERAAELANIKHYEVVSVRDEYLSSLDDSELTSALELYEKLDSQAKIDLSSQETEWPSFYQLYIPLE